MGRLIDVDKFLEKVKKDREHEIYLHSWTADMILERLDSWYAPTVETIPKDNVYKAIQEMMKYEHEGFINISLARLDEILKKCEVSEDAKNT